MKVPSSSLAAVFHAPLQPFELLEVPIPQMQTGYLLVEVLLCTICGSDLHTWHGRRAAPSPSVLGHEIVGRLLWPPSVLDGNGERLRAGERLIWSLASSCGHCPFCAIGLTQKCCSLMKYGHHALSEDWPLSGGLAEHCMLVPGTFFLKLPDTVPDALAAPATCATATVASALSCAGEVAGQTVLVMGAGMLGNTACAMLDAAGAARVIVADSNIQRAKDAERFGAVRHLDATLAPSDFEQAARDLTAGYGADIVIDFAGVNDAVQRAIRATRVGGQCLLAGSVFPQPSLDIHAEDIVRRMLHIHGVYNYVPANLRSALHFLITDAARYPLADLVGDRYPLCLVQRAFEQAAAPQAPCRIAICPSASQEKI